MPEPWIRIGVRLSGTQGKVDGWQQEVRLCLAVNDQPPTCRLTKAALELLVCDGSGKNVRP
jgi:hypothetical protein